MFWNSSGSVSELKMFYICSTNVPIYFCGTVLEQFQNIMCSKTVLNLELQFLGKHLIKKVGVPELFLIISDVSESMLYMQTKNNKKYITHRLE